MKISIITAAYNAANSIRATLDSVAEQDHPDIEHIVVDGASPDGTAAVVKAYGRRVAALISEPDAGVYDAFNKGLARATGEAIGFLNAGDTYLSPRAVSTLAAHMRADVGAVFADLLIVDEHDPSRVVRRYDSGRFSPRMLPYGVMPAHPTLFLRREVYRSAGGYDTRFRIAGDFDLCLRVFHKRRIGYRHIPQALVRMPRGGLSNRGWRSKRDITLEMRRACMLRGVRTNMLKLCLRFPLKALEVVAARGR